MRKLLLALVVLAVPAILMAAPGVGDPAPDFTLPDTAGVNHSLTDYTGKVVQLFFWQST
jgi:peroxiredoxin